MTELEQVLLAACQSALEAIKNHRTETDECSFRFHGVKRTLEDAIAQASSEEPKGDPTCEQCHGQGCSQCNDEIYYAQEDVAEQWRRDRRIDARHIYGVEF